MFAQLKSQVSDTKEHGYTYKMNSSTGIDETAITGLDGDKYIDVAVNEKIDGFMHSHYTNSLSVFSAGDIFAMATIYVEDLMVNPKTFTVGVVTANGTQYILMIDDLAKFHTFSTSLLANQTADTYEYTYSKIYGITESRSNNANEKAFMQYIEQNNSGLKLFKGNGSFDEWKPKKVDEYGFIVNDPC